MFTDLPLRVKYFDGESSDDTTNPSFLLKPPKISSLENSKIGTGDRHIQEKKLAQRNNSPNVENYLKIVLIKIELVIFVLVSHEISSGGFIWRSSPCGCC